MKQHKLHYLTVFVSRVNCQHFHSCISVRVFIILWSLLPNRKNQFWPAPSSASWWLMMKLFGGGSACDGGGDCGLWSTAACPPFNIGAARSVSRGAGLLCWLPAYTERAGGDRQFIGLRTIAAEPGPVRRAEPGLSRQIACLRRRVNDIPAWGRLDMTAKHGGRCRGRRKEGLTQRRRRGEKRAESGTPPPLPPDAALRIGGWGRALRAVFCACCFKKTHDGLLSLFAVLGGSGRWRKRVLTESTAIDALNIVAAFEDGNKAMLVTINRGTMMQTTI